MTMDPKNARSLALHWYHGAALFNAKLSKPINQAERDAIWAAAALLGTSAFTDTRGAKTPEESWPLIPPTPSDLHWLKLNDKRVVLNIISPLRPESVFHRMLAEAIHDISPLPCVGDEVNNLPPQFIELFGLEPSSTFASNPYHCSATLLAQVMPYECCRANIVMFLSCLSKFDAPFLALLEKRDPPALLLLAYWYAKVVSYRQWWVWRRAMLEGPAICLYLQKTCAESDVIIELLEFPRSAFVARGCTSLL
jgi:hypothetical protein